ncbi:flagellar m-ring protein : Flagellar M-ring protein OS=Thermodesulfatator indicus (strain DSM 15286 / JCM 11887 / CIR29812) GN=Thein_1812 PE=3 SV=1: YscJ_FliF: YscJ_FliF_C [Gemmataceae bacterium]|nr:flagellar m-ring protein : Flagellar M-ring protein OS=Thermodesulfatator indicus (strain DSM 15286 / JCM 11887 / CIR29812) GN=Thein_1812 PE=3 SV=1: YscJ_FliF: YscJ_FliF_C [Gemmataceae bacterium]VTT97895.1 flagellar m-ring protein : Flagellar M-ring protein OS=Thermodesulfatator indicus (strain DSM 15286 / JCM 11887 / CIR29812) GN=Thein_1812 PE=3 SV=1: YscJ_FliF: YscJ_FliF_C [Gemmataceae bacterium]
MDVFRRLLEQLKAYWAGLSRARRVAVVGAVAVAALSVAAVGYFSAGTPYRALYSELSPEEAGAMTTRLTAQNIPNRLALGGTAVEVPEDKLAQARVALATEGLPARGGKGYELFDETSLMTTPFVQGVNYQRALQAELTRSITQLESVQSARVLIARPEPTPFVRDQRPPTASVILKLKPGSVMSRGTAASVVSLVARSVDGLKPENVTVVDSAGRLLSDPHAGDRDALPTPQLEYRRELETYLAGKAEQMLAQHLGPGRAVVRVSADINFQQVKERQETYAPDGRVAATERLTTSSSTAARAGGVAGAASNVARAGGAPPGPSGTGGGSSKEELIQTDYLVSKTIRDMEDRLGGVVRLNVAAMVDLAAPAEGGAVISAADAQEIIKQAVGFRTGRDEVKLTNVRLGGPVGPQEPDETLAQIQRIQAYVGLARNVSLALAVVMVVATVGLLVVRRRTPPVPDAPPAAPEAKTPTDEDRRRAELDRLVELARTSPDRVADVFRMLVGAPAR